MIPDRGSLIDVIFAEKGILHLRLAAAGEAAHAARPWLGVNASERILDGVWRVRDELFALLQPERIDPDDLATLHGHDEWIEIDSMLDDFEIRRRYALATSGAAVSVARDRAGAGS